MLDALPITHLRRGDVAHISQVAGSPEQVRRLDELGLRDGVRIEIVQSGSPCIVRVGGAKLCLRHDDLLRVLVIRRKTA